MQLAGYLRSRALQEWNLLNKENRSTYEEDVKVLRTWLHPGNQILEALDFCHAQDLTQNINLVGAE